MISTKASSTPQAVREQLYRYAQDLQELMDQHGKLQQRYQMVLQSQGRASLSNDLLLSSIRHSDALYLITDGQGAMSYASPGTESLLGETVSALRGLSILHLTPQSQRADMTELLSQLISTQQSTTVVQRQLTLFNGAETHSTSLVDALILPTQNYDRLEIFWLLHAADDNNSDAISVQANIGLLQNSDKGLMITDIDGTIRFTNPAFTRITGYEASEVLGQNPRMLSSGRHDGAFYRLFWTELLKTGSWSGEFFNRRKNGQIYPEWKTVKVVKNAVDATVSFISVFADSSHQHTDTEQLSRLAYHDALTGLPNRRLLEDRLTQALSQMKRDGSGLSLLFIDLDRFKPINDALGHEVGDLVLQEISQRLKKSVRQGDTAARVGGDEFVILLQNTVRREDVQNIANTLLTALTEPIIAGEQKLLLGASIGCSRYPQDGDDIGVLLKNADSAMYSAKRSGGNHFCFFEPLGGHSALANLGLDLWRALERGEMHLLYQPQVTAEGQLHGCEALLRWTHPVLGEVAPLTFIPIAETNGAILPLGDWVLETACRQLREWQKTGLEHLNMSVNVSSRQLHDPGFVHRVCQILLTTGVAPNTLELELTETEVLQFKDGDQKRLQALRALGVKIAIDDFGTGYSSLSTLNNLPVDRLKIDQCFIRNLACSSNARAVSQCFVTLGQSMGLEVIAEGVETTEQLQVLSAQGCHLIQGFFTGRPMKADALLIWCQEKTTIPTP